MSADTGMMTRSETADAAGIPAQTLLTWFQRGHLRTGAGDILASPGGTHLLGPSTVRQALRFANLVKAGLTPKAASQLLSEPKDGPAFIALIRAIGDTQ